MKWINNTARQKKIQIFKRSQETFLVCCRFWIKNRWWWDQMNLFKKKNDSRDQENHNKKNENLNFSKITIIHLLPSSYTNNDDPQMILIGFFFTFTFTVHLSSWQEKKSDYYYYREPKKRKWKIMGNSQRWHFELRWQQKQFKKWRKKDWNNG